jgi:anti-anti-sigma factor
MASPFTTMYVSRDVERPVHDVSLALEQLPHRTTCGGVSLALRSTETRRQPTSACDPWRAIPASLRIGRVRPAFRVSLEALPWSDTRSQLGLRPEGRSSRAWPSSFCDAAHTVLEHLRSVVLDTIASAAPSAAPGEISCKLHDVEFDDGHNVALVKVAGDLHYHTSDELREEVTEPIGAGARRVLVDLAGVRSVDSAGLATLVYVTHTATRERADTSLTLTAVPESIKDTIEDLGYAELLQVA